MRRVSIRSGFANHFKFGKNLYTSRFLTRSFGLVVESSTGRSAHAVFRVSQAHLYSILLG